MDVDEQSSEVQCNSELTQDLSRMIRFKHCILYMIECLDISIPRTQEDSHKEYLGRSRFPPDDEEGVAESSIPVVAYEHQERNEFTQCDILSIVSQSNHWKDKGGCFLNEPSNSSRDS